MGIAPLSAELAVLGMELDMARLNYVELTARDAERVGAAKAFYESAFGWSLTEYGPEYAGGDAGGTELGLRADEGGKAALPGIAVADLEAALDKVTGLGAEIVVPIFAFPGGRRFHFRDPAGNELACFKYD
jgi:predicted enzyme related to lactoylglutathione lyase